MTLPGFTAEVGTAPAGQLKRVENSSAMNWPSMLPEVPPMSSGVT